MGVLCSRSTSPLPREWCALQLVSASILSFMRQTPSHLPLPPYPALTRWTFFPDQEESNGTSTAWLSGTWGWDLHSGRAACPS